VYNIGERPSRVLKPGLDLPVWFIDDLLSIDRNFHFVFHDWRLVWDDVMNKYTGSLEDPRFCVGLKYEKECWGWPLTDNEGHPIPENRWHVWNHVNDVGYYHVIDINSRKPEHLKRIAKLIHKEAKLKDQGRRAYIDAKIEQQELELERKEQLGRDKWEFLAKENEPLLRKAKENFELGKWDPTNPTKEQIMSYPNQDRRSKVITPLEDEDVGLATWDDVNDE
jgi:hypothetical protein